MKWNMSRHLGGTAQRGDDLADGLDETHLTGKSNVELPVVRRVDDAARSIQVGGAAQPPCSGCALAFLGVARHDSLAQAPVAQGAHGDARNLVEIEQVFRAGRRLCP